MKEKSWRAFVVPLLLLAAIALSVYAHSMVFREWHMPTYGNTMIHVANARHLVEHAAYPLENDYSYGGGVPNLYVPVYRFLVGESVLLTGLDFDAASRLLVLLFALLLPLGFFVLGRALFGEWVGLASAFFASLVPELLIYTVRPLPQGLGMVLLPIAFYLIVKEMRWQAVFFAVVVSLVHQEAGIVLVGSCFAVFCLNAVVSAARAFFERKKVFVRSAVHPIAWLALWCWLAGTLAYVGWHFVVLGNFNVFGLAQFSQHEGGPVEFALLLTKTGKVVTALSLAGLVLLGLAAAIKARARKGIEKELFLFALFLAGLFLIKNDVFGLRVFMDRFIVFLDEFLILLAAFALVCGLAVLKKVLAREEASGGLEFSNWF